MATTEEIRAAIDHYLETFSGGDGAAWAACFAEDGTQEDPVGAPVNTGRAAIQSFHDNMTTTFGSLALVLKEEPVIIGHEAALSCYAQAGDGEGRMRMPRIIDVLTFTEDGLISSLRAFWTMESITPDPA